MSEPKLDRVAIIATALCRSGKFETGEGTCSLRCMDQLGDARRACSHVREIHLDLARHIDEALRANESVTPPPERKQHDT